MIERVVLTRDIVDAHGAVLAQRGSVIDPSTIEAAARRAPALTRITISATRIAEELMLPLADPPYRHLFRGRGVGSAVKRALLAIRLPQVLFDELLALKRVDPARYRHGLTTAAVAARLIIGAVGEAPALPEFTAAGLLHDLGMRHVTFDHVRNADALDTREMHDIAAHPLLGAWHLANVLGMHPGVEAALAHHWRNGHGYPLLPRPPMRAVEVVGVASAFAALTQARAFRSEPYDARGAVDVIVSEARTGQRDGEAVRLLVHALRGGRGDVRTVAFARARLGHAPAVNRHTPIAVFRVAS